MKLTVTEVRIRPEDSPDGMGEYVMTCDEMEHRICVVSKRQVELGDVFHEGCVFCRYDF